MTSDVMPKPTSKNQLHLLVDGGSMFDSEGTIKIITRDRGIKEEKDIAVETPSGRSDRGGIVRNIEMNCR
ncbi:MAG: hypothetical protein ACRD43_03655 [Pyrinomonadaceae bacterium]